MVGLIVSVATGPGLFSVEGALLTKVPMQGAMLMPEVSYTSSDGRLHVAMPVEIPQLIPLLVSHPADSFDPADPWTHALDPSEMGLSFSRRYGFVMSASTEQPPENTQIWIRKLSGSPELLAFRYRDSSPKMFEPIFGTGGATNALYWNGMMFHPVFAAPARMAGLSATFELYLLDTASGREVPNSSTGPLHFEWTNIPDGRPALALHREPLEFSWPVTTATWALEGTESLVDTSWSALSGTPAVQNGHFTLSMPPGETRRFFRLRLVR